MIKHLTYTNTEPVHPYHAAQGSAATLASSRGPLHDHDFYEMLYVLHGGAIHVEPQGETRLETGTLMFVRPPDRHTFYVKPGQRASFINIAFPSTEWRSFCAIAQIDPNAPWGVPSDGPLTAGLPVEQAHACAAAFDAALNAYFDSPCPLHLTQFWSATLLPMVSRAEGASSLPLSAPDWLRVACLAMREAENAAAGVTRFVELAGVSPAHLSRVVRDVLGLTPTEYVNDIRFRRAAMLLVTTDQDIIGIVLDCGFESVSYFYRQFRQRFGPSPREYRRTNSLRVVP